MSAPDLVPLLLAWRDQDGPLHHRLASSLTSLIDARLLRPGDRLPSERHLARRLSISRTTTSGAYDLLRQRGTVTSVRGSGTTVAGTRAPRRDTSLATLAANPFIGDTDRARPSEVIDLTVCRFAPPAILVDALTDNQALLALIGDGHHTAGLPDLRDAVAEHLTSQGLPTNPSQLLITTGSQQALALAASDLERNDRVLVEDPTYFGALHAYLQRGARLVPVPVADLDRATTLTADERRLDLIHVTSAVHNPTGRQLATSTGRRLVELATRCGATLVDDQALRYLSDEPRPFLAGHDPHADVITVGSFSKVLWSALRIGWLRAPAPTIRRLVARKAALDLATPAIDQALVLHCLPHLDPIAAQRRERLRQARTHLRNRIRADLPHWRNDTSDAGPFLWLRTHLDDADAVVQAAATAGVLLTAGRTLSPSERWNAHVRVALTAPDDAFDTVVDRLADAPTDHRR